jgi:hypothetical protein
MKISRLKQKSITLYLHIKSIITCIGSFKNLKLLIFPKNIPLIIINFNQLFYFKQLVDFALKRGFKNIVIIDNASTYPPLLAYYEQIKNQVCIEKMSINTGHKVFFENEYLYQKYGKSFFILTDADIIPNENLPKNFMNTLLYWLILKNRTITKVGFALELNDIPDHYDQKQKVLDWEKQFWQSSTKKDVYFASVDTTFAMYKPNPKKHLTESVKFLSGLRIAGNFTSKHGGWYMDNQNPTDEQKYYIALANSSSSWLSKESNMYENI